MKGKTEHNWLHGGYVAIPAHEALPLVARPWMRLSTNCRVPPSSKRVTSQWKPLAMPWGGSCIRVTLTHTVTYASACHGSFHPMRTSRMLCLAALAGELCHYS